MNLMHVRNSYLFKKRNATIFPGMNGVKHNRKTRKNSSVFFLFTNIFYTERSKSKNKQNSNKQILHKKCHIVHQKISIKQNLNSPAMSQKSSCF